jgi:hypothetical protein
MTISDSVSRRPSGYGHVPSPFAMDGQVFQDLGHQLVDTMSAYLDELPGKPVYSCAMVRRGECAPHYALDEGHIESIVEAVRDAGSRCAAAF